MPINAGGVGISFGRRKIDEPAPEWKKPANHATIKNI